MQKLVDLGQQKQKQKGKARNEGNIKGMKVKNGRERESERGGGKYEREHE